MKVRKLKPVIAALLVAGSLGAVSVHAQALDGTGIAHSHSDYLDAPSVAPLTDEWSLLGHVDDPRVNLQTPHVDDRGSHLKLDFEPQHWLHSFEFHDAWENYHLPPLDDRPAIEQYRFGARVAF